jgi:hypothetical protein
MSDRNPTAPNAAERRGTPGHRNPVVNFLGIGVQKAGTTWLHKMLGAHPEIYVAQADDKDLRFFNSFYDFGYRWYEAYFAKAKTTHKRGEFSTSYFYSKDAPERVYRYNPEMRLILSLRIPVNRLISHHRHEIRIGNLKGDLSLQSGLENNPSYIEQSMYFTQLSRWLDCFSLSQLHIVIFEDLFREPASAIRDLYRFLGVEPGFVPEDLSLKVNEGRIPRSWLVDKSVSASTAAFRRIGLGWLVDRLKAARLNKMIETGNTMEDEVMEISDTDYQRLRAIFASENSSLASLLGRDLSVWED